MFVILLGFNLFKLVFTHLVIPLLPRIHSRKGLTWKQKFFHGVRQTSMMEGDKAVRTFLNFFICMSMTYSFFQHNMFVENFRSSLLLMEVMMLVMYEDFSIYGPMFCMSIHCCDLI
mmetsp:Transcript_24016/g.36935  ORF Transcript_24016/g.36935 Transcript_24016/m.36935 type:complete len:116 (-) Transcript_24016:438-785(-)